MDKIWKIKINNGGPGMEFAMSGQPTKEGAKSEFERQQKIIDNKGVPYFPEGKVTVEDPDEKFVEKAMTVKPKKNIMHDDIEALS